MEEFLKKFFPSVYKKSEASSSNTNQYCKFDSQLLTLFTSSLYLAALVASFAASVCNKLFGRKVTMLVGGIIFLVGAFINGFAQDVAMLIIGRILLGIGVGFDNSVCIISCINVTYVNKLCNEWIIKKLFSLIICRLFLYIYPKWHHQILEEHLIFVFKWPLQLES